MTKKIETSSGPVSYAVDGRGGPVVLLAHGAGADMHSDFMSVFAAGLAEHGMRAVRFNFHYTEVRKKAPDRQPILEKTYREVAEAIATKLRPDALFIGGKSMGGRIASHLAAAGDVAVDGVVFLGYPLHAPGRPDRVRSAHLYDVKVPMLFVEGTRDPFCPLDTLRALLPELKAKVELAVIDDGDHSLKVRRSSGRSTDDAWSEAIDLVAGWVKKHS